MFNFGDVVFVASVFFFGGSAKRVLKGADESVGFGRRQSAGTDAPSARCDTDSPQQALVLLVPDR
jgi:hypothetical protein